MAKIRARIVKLLADLEYRTDFSRWRSPMPPSIPMDTPIYDQLEREWGKKWYLR